MTLTAALSVIVELLFSAVFAGALLDYARRRDPVNRDVALTFSPFVGLLVVYAWRVALGPPPVVLSVIAALLLFAQPVFALHLVSLIRPVPRRVIVGGAILLVASLGPVILLRSGGAIAALPLLAAFASVELVTAGYLANEARRRKGPGRIRLALAGGSTVLFAVGLLTTVAGLLGPQVEPRQKTALFPLR